MARVIFWDVDTQYDFMHADGKLYVPEAERIITNLQRLTNYAHGHGIRIVASADDHVMGHPEIIRARGGADHHEPAAPDELRARPRHPHRGERGRSRHGASRDLRQSRLAEHLPGTLYARHRRPEEDSRDGTRGSARHRAGEDRCEGPGRSDTGAPGGYPVPQA